MNVNIFANHVNFVDDIILYLSSGYYSLNDLQLVVEYMMMEEMSNDLEEVMVSVLMSESEGELEKALWSIRKRISNEIRSPKFYVSYVSLLFLRVQEGNLALNDFLSIAGDYMDGRECEYMDCEFFYSLLNKLEEGMVRYVANSIICKFHEHIGIYSEKILFMEGLLTVVKMTKSSQV